MANHITRRPACSFSARLTAMALAASAGAIASAQLQPQIGPQIRVDTGGTFAANETSAVAGPFQPLDVVMGWNDWRPSGASEVIRCAFAWTTDGGVTWTDDLIRPPVPNQSTVEGDPMTAVDPRTGYSFVGGISFSAGGNSGIYVARKAPGAASFEPAVMARTTGGTDKPWMAAGQRPNMPGTTRLYVGYNEGLIWSDDLGLTWTNPVDILPEFGLGLLPRIGPNGALYISYWDADFGVKLARSFDGGASFDIVTIATRMDTWGTGPCPTVPGTFRVALISALAVDANSGRLYSVHIDTTSMAGAESNVDMYLATSDDQGATWSDPEIIRPMGEGGPADATPGDQFFPWVEVDDDGRVHLIYFDTSEAPGSDNDGDATLDARYAYSVNGGATWIEHRLSPASFAADDDGLDRFNQFIGDYLGIAVAGRTSWPSYVDMAAGDPDVFTHVMQLPRPNDINGDGAIDFADLASLLAAWGPCPAFPCAQDVNGDGIIGFADLLAVLSSYD